jgi:predicted Ser/Thr protein kinase
MPFAFSRFGPSSEPPACGVTACRWPPRKRERCSLSMQSHEHARSFVWADRHPLVCHVFKGTVHRSLLSLISDAFDTTSKGKMRNRKVLGVLNIDLDLVNDAHETPEKGFLLGDTTYRHDGFSIGKDYLRLEGRTVTRGELVPSSLTVDELIGEGAFSKVHRGLWKQKGESVEVAVKQFCLLESSPQRRNMLLKELRALCNIDSECLVRFQGAFLEIDTVTMVLEYMDQGSLEQLLESKNEKLSEKFIASVAFQMLWGLSYLHHEKILHRDIKPGNLLIHSNGGVKLCDFGIASLSDNALNTTVVGTTRYMAPERLRARPYGRPSDVWSLGLVILECFTRERPWEETDSLVSLVITVEEMPIEDLIPSSLSSRAREMLMGCLQHHPGKCTQSLCCYLC